LRGTVVRLDDNDDDGSKNNAHPLFLAGSSSLNIEVSFTIYLYACKTKHNANFTL